MAQDIPSIFLICNASQHHPSDKNEQKPSHTTSTTALFQHFQHYFTHLVRLSFLFTFTLHFLYLRASLQYNNGEQTERARLARFQRNQGRPDLSERLP